eukprot:14675-Heterococcus_DN1.PRE.17
MDQHVLDSWIQQGLRQTCLKKVVALLQAPQARMHSSHLYIEGLAAYPSAAGFTAAGVSTHLSRWLVLSLSLGVCKE